MTWTPLRSCMQSRDVRHSCIRHRTASSIWWLLIRRAELNWSPPADLGNGRPEHKHEVTVSVLSSPFSSLKRGNCANASQVFFQEKRSDDGYQTCCVFLHMRWHIYRHQCARQTKSKQKKVCGKPGASSWEEEGTTDGAADQTFHVPLPADENASATS